MDLCRWLLERERANPSLPDPCCAPAPRRAATVVGAGVLAGTRRSLIIVLRSLSCRSGRSRATHVSPLGALWWLMRPQPNFAPMFGPSLTCALGEFGPSLTSIDRLRPSSAEFRSNFAQRGSKLGQMKPNFAKFWANLADFGQHRFKLGPSRDNVCGTSAESSQFRPHLRRVWQQNVRLGLCWSNLGQTRPKSGKFGNTRADQARAREPHVIGT